MPNNTVTGPDVPVVPATAKRLNLKTIATLVTAIGAVITTLQQAVPTLTALFPKQAWIGHAVTAAGFLWMAYQRATEANAVMLTNYSVPTLPEQPETEGDAMAATLGVPTVAAWPPRVAPAKPFVPPATSEANTGNGSKPPSA